MSEQLMVCKALAALVRRKGEPDEAEVTFVATAAMEQGLTPEENEQVQQVLKEGGDYDALLGEITSRPMRAYLFRRVVAATLLDEELEDHELETIHRTADAFGFAREPVQAYIEWMKEGIAWEKRGAALMAQIQPVEGEPPEPPPFEG